MDDGRDERRGGKRPIGTAAIPPVIVIHSLAHAVAALDAARHIGRPITLASPPGAGIYAGAGWFGALIVEARASVPEARFTALLDCAEDAGAAQGAIRAGVEGIVFTGRAEVALRLADIAAQAGVRLVTEPPDPALDLGGDFFATPDALRRRCIDAIGPL